MRRSVRRFDDLVADLELIDEGIRLRRRHFDSEGAAVEREFFDRLLKLQHRTTVHLADRAGSFDAGEINDLSDRLDRALGTDRSHLDRFLAKGSPPNVVALQLERFRGDLMWRDQLLHACLGRTPPHPSFQARAALDAAMQMAVAPTSVDFADLREDVERRSPGRSPSAARNPRRRRTDLRQGTARSDGGVAATLRALPVASGCRSGSFAGFARNGESARRAARCDDRSRLRSAGELRKFRERVERWTHIQENTAASLIESAASADTVKEGHALRLLEINVEDADRVRKQLAAERERTFDDATSETRPRVQAKPESGSQSASGSPARRTSESAVRTAAFPLVGSASCSCWCCSSSCYCSSKRSFCDSRSPIREANPGLFRFFAFADLVICSVFLFDFALATDSGRRSLAVFPPAFHRRLPGGDSLRLHRVGGEFRGGRRGGIP